MKQNNPNDSIVQSKQVYVDNAIGGYVDKLQREQGYENITYELSKVAEMADLYHIPSRVSVDLDSAIIRRYDYYAEYYKVAISGKEYLFKTKDSANDFVSKLKKYGVTNVSVERKKDFISKETPQKDIDAEVSTQRSAYEKKVAEEKARKAQAASQNRTSSIPQATGSAAEYQSYAHNLVINTYGWSEYDYECLVKLWYRESGWNPNSHNKSSGAHGIPQALPASKMASEGSDYYTNGYTQIRWGLKYIKGRYGTPAAAWSHSQQKGWY